MNRTIAFVNRICDKNNICNDIKNLLYSFLFRTHHQCVIHTLHLAHFRRNENHPILDSIKNPHWYFYENKQTAKRYLYIQARNCNKCGGYTQTKRLCSLRIRCRCLWT